MKIAIIGTRGIPNHYGGFEQCAEYLSIGLVKKGYDVTVYSSSNHPFQEKEWEGVHIVHMYDPEDRLGTIGQFIYDYKCIRDCKKRKYDIILQLGYTSSSIWGRLLPMKQAIVTTNMDGLEWKRTKYTAKVQRFLKYAEGLAVKYSHHLISDSIGIQKYLEDKYQVKSTFIPYGANSFQQPRPEVLPTYNVTMYRYNILIARLEHENNIETILDGFVASGIEHPFLVIGNHKTKYGNYLKDKYQATANVRFVGAIYDIDILNNLRYYSNLYFHGHTVGGTNPSLLEAMASHTVICAHNNIFNRSILEDDAYYFDTAEDVKALLLGFPADCKLEDQCIEKMSNNMEKVDRKYSWKQIIDEYYEHFETIFRASTKTGAIVTEMPKRKLEGAGKK